MIIFYELEVLLLAAQLFCLQTNFCVPGGAIGVTPLQAGIFGLVASFVTMATGHRIGLHLATLSNKGSFSRQRQNSNDGEVKHDSFFSQYHLLLDPSFASGNLLGILCLMSIQELLAI